MQFFKKAESDQNENQVEDETSKFEAVNANEVEAILLNSRKDLINFPIV